jgi:hypothetical protein
MSPLTYPDGARIRERQIDEAVLNDAHARGLLAKKAVAEAAQRAAVQNVLAAVNPKVFPGYWSVCADGQGFGYGNTHPSLDGHQTTDALLWLGENDVINFNAGDHDISVSMRYADYVQVEKPEPGKFAEQKEERSVETTHCLARRSPETVRRLRHRQGRLLE